MRPYAGLDPIEVADEFVTVNKELLDLGRDDVAAVKLTIGNDAALPVAVQLVETFPPSVSVEDVEIHPRYGRHKWTISPADRELVFEDVIPSDGEIETLYGVHLPDEDGVDAFLGEPVIALTQLADEGTAGSSSIPVFRGGSATSTASDPAEPTVAASTPTDATDEDTGSSTPSDAADEDTGSSTAPEPTDAAESASADAEPAASSAADAAANGPSSRSESSGSGRPSSVRPDQPLDGDAGPDSGPTVGTTGEISDARSANEPFAFGEQRAGSDDAASDRDGGSPPTVDPTAAVEALVDALAGDRLTGEQRDAIRGALGLDGLGDVPQRLDELAAAVGERSAADDAVERLGDEVASLSATVDGVGALDAVVEELDAVSALVAELDDVSAVVEELEGFADVAATLDDVAAVAAEVGSLSAAADEVASLSAAVDDLRSSTDRIAGEVSARSGALTAAAEERAALEAQLDRLERDVASLHEAQSAGFEALDARLETLATTFGTDESFADLHDVVAAERAWRRRFVEDR